MDMEVRSEDLRNAANDLRKYLQRMKASNDDATNTINGTAGNWESNAAENLRGRYTNLSRNFDDFYNAIEKYATYLDNTAASYEEADNKIEQKAEDLLNQGYNG